MRSSLEVCRPSGASKKACTWQFRAKPCFPHQVGMERGGFFQRVEHLSPEMFNLDFLQIDVSFRLNAGARAFARRGANPNCVDPPPPLDLPRASSARLTNVSISRGRCPFLSWLAGSSSFLQRLPHRIHNTFYRHGSFWQEAQEGNTHQSCHREKPWRDFAEMWLQGVHKRSTKTLVLLLLRLQVEVDEHPFTGVAL